MVCGSLEEMPEKSWVARLQAGLAALVAFSGIIMVGCRLVSNMTFHQCLLINKYLFILIYIWPLFAYERSTFGLFYVSLAALAAISVIIIVGCGLYFVLISDLLVCLWKLAIVFYNLLFSPFIGLFINLLIFNWYFSFALMYLIDF